MGRIIFNTAYSNSQSLEFSLIDISPNQTLKDKRFPQDFKFIVKICADYIKINILYI